MRTHNTQTKELVISLRKQGKTYSEIGNEIGIEIPKSTIATWCRSVVVSDEHKKRVSEMVKNNLAIARQKAQISKKQKREKYLQKIKKRINGIENKLDEKEVSKITLATLCLKEASKKTDSLTIASADPSTIKLFLKLLRYCYRIDEHKFRCTLQTRVGSEIDKQEEFWRQTTGVRKEQFYETRIDKRTEGKRVKKNHRGVCRIDYHSTDILWELKTITKALFEKDLSNTGH